MSSIEATLEDYRLATGRQALAEGKASEICLARCGPGPVGELLALCWHRDAAIRQAAALALPAGDGRRAYRPARGHFADALLRRLSHRAPEPAHRYETVVRALADLLDAVAQEIRGLGNMKYSFLGSSLYLAVLSTCRDALDAARRLRAASTHPAVCRVLWSLACLRRAGRINNEDLDALSAAAGRALGAVPAAEVPVLWAELRHHSLHRRLAVAPVIDHLHDPIAVNHLIGCIDGQPDRITASLVAAIGRMGDDSAADLLAAMAASHPSRAIRSAARNASISIRRRASKRCASTLLRATEGWISSELLTPVRRDADANCDSELLRSSSVWPE